MIYGLDGKPISANMAPEGKMTKTSAGAVIISEIDLAIERWNKSAVEQYGDAAHTFKVSFDKYEYTLELKEKHKLFGYAKLCIILKREGLEVEIYNNGQSFNTERELNNTNGYFPGLAFDCIAFLIGSGLMYNLALAEQNPNKPREPQNAEKRDSEPGTGTETEPGNRN